VIGKAGVMALPPCVLARHIHTHTRTHTLRLGFVRFPVDIFGIAPLRCLTLLVSLAIRTQSPDTIWALHSWSMPPPKWPKRQPPSISPSLALPPRALHVVVVDGLMPR